MEEQTIFIVEGSTGEYSDHCEWIVCAFTDKNDAREMVDKCTAEYLRIQQELDNLREDNGYFFYDFDVKEGKLEKHKFDPKFNIDYTGTNYTYYKCQLLSKN